MPKSEYLDRAENAQKYITKSIAKQRRKDFYRIGGPVAGAGMIGTAALGAVAGAPFAPLAAGIAGMSLLADANKKRADKRSLKAKNNRAYVKRGR